MESHESHISARFKNPPFIHLSLQLPSPDLIRMASQTIELESGNDVDEINPIFSQVLSSVRLEYLPIYCATVRKELIETAIATPIEPVTIEQPLFGSFHVLFPIKFQDNTRWLLKVPACGSKTQFDHAASAALRSEALTLRLIRQKTSIPVPIVYDFDASVDNDLGVPFILMSFIPGQSLYDSWFDRSIPQTELYSRRTRTLQDLAQAMVQLHQFSFTHGGSPSFNEEGALTDIGPMRCVDHDGMIKRMTTASDDDVTPLYFNAGPFTDAKSYYFHAINHQAEPDQSLQVGLQKLVRLFLDWIPEVSAHEHHFVLTHPDLDIQNIIVSQDGHIQGIIDWDGVAALPRSVGNERYPSWLTRDWDPAMYGWDEDMERGVEPTGLWEDSPLTLARHRKEYRQFIQFYSPPPPPPDQPTGLTAHSLFVENLLIAAENPICRYDILRKFVDRIVELVSQNPDRTSLTETGKSGGEDTTAEERLGIFDIIDAFMSGTFESGVKSMLRKGFEALLQSE
jgi:hypothetical protein